MKLGILSFALFAVSVNGQQYPSFDYQPDQPHGFDTPLSGGAYQQRPSSYGPQPNIHDPIYSGPVLRDQGFGRPQGSIRARPDGPLPAGNSQESPVKPLRYNTPDRNCTVEKEEIESELCIPTLETACSEVNVTLMVPEEKNECVMVTRTVCKSSIEDLNVDVCSYSYTTEDVQATAKVADVKYSKRCETTLVSKCNQVDTDCKDIPQETCYNSPSVKSKDMQVTLSIPKPEKKCDIMKISAPKVNCRDLQEERCFVKVTMKEKVEKVEKCISKLGKPKCENIKLSLPKQVCKELVVQGAVPHESGSLPIPYY